MRRLFLSRFQILRKSLYNPLVCYLQSIIYMMLKKILLLISLLILSACNSNMNAGGFDGSGIAASEGNNFSTVYIESSYLSFLNTYETLLDQETDLSPVQIEILSEAESSLPDLAGINYIVACNEVVWGTNEICLNISPQLLTSSLTTDYAYLLAIHLGFSETEALEWASLF